MAAAFGRSSRSPKVNATSPYRLLSTDRSKKSTAKTKTKTDEDVIDPVEQRINQIYMHLLSGKAPRHVIPAEPTLVFQRFLFLGGLKSLNDKVSHLTILDR